MGKYLREKMTAECPINDSEIPKRGRPRKLFRGESHEAVSEETAGKLLQAPGSRQSGGLSHEGRSEGSTDTRNLSMGRGYGLSDCNLKPFHGIGLDDFETGRDIKNQRNVRMQMSEDADSMQNRGGGAARRNGLDIEDLFDFRIMDENPQGFQSPKKQSDEQPSFRDEAQRANKPTIDQAVSGKRGIDELFDVGGGFNGSVPSSRYLDDLVPDYNSQSMTSNGSLADTQDWPVIWPPYASGAADNEKPAYATDNRQSYRIENDLFSPSIPLPLDGPYGYQPNGREAEYKATNYCRLPSRTAVYWDPRPPDPYKPVDLFIEETSSQNYAQGLYDNGQNNQKYRDAAPRGSYVPHMTGPHDRPPSRDCCFSGLPDPSQQEASRCVENLNYLYRQPQPVDYRSIGMLCGTRKKRRSSPCIWAPAVLNQDYAGTIPPSRYSSLEYIQGGDARRTFGGGGAAQPLQQEKNRNNYLLSVIIDSNKPLTDDYKAVLQSYKSDVTKLDMENITVFQLKALTKEYGLSQSGKKNDLIDLVKNTLIKIESMDLELSGETGVAPKQEIPIDEDLCYDRFFF